MEDLIGLLIFLAFAGFSFIGNLVKKQQASGEPVSKSLKDILTTIQDELQGKSEEVPVVPKKTRKQPKGKPETPVFEEVVNRTVEQAPLPMGINEGRAVKPQLTKEQLRQVMIWKEILDKPVSMR